MHYRALYSFERTGIIMFEMLKYMKKLIGRNVMKKPNAEEIIEFLNQKWKTKTCPMCGEHDWSINGSNIFELREFKDGDLIIGTGTAILPVIPVTCDNCGNTIFISALSTGLMKKE